MGPNVSARDYYWLDLAETSGMGTQALAKQLSVSKRTVQLALARARADRRVTDTLAVPPVPPPPLRVPLFPIAVFTPQSKCPHKGPIPRYSSFICMVCHQDKDDGRRLKNRAKNPVLAGLRGRNLADRCRAGEDHRESG